MWGLLRFMLICALGCSALGCAISSSYMTQLVEPQQIQADPESATVVFVRPSGYAGRNKSIILDQEGRFIGECWGQTYFAARITPGEHMFFAWSEGTPTLMATVEAGKIYYVEVAMTLGAWGSRARLFAIGPERSTWVDLPTWLGKSTMLTLNEAAGQTLTLNRRKRILKIIQKGKNNYFKYAPAEKKRRTLRLDDGVDEPMFRAQSPK